MGSGGSGATIGLERNDPRGMAAYSAATIKRRMGNEGLDVAGGFDIGFIYGSGLAEADNALGNQFVEVPMADIPGLYVPNAAKHVPLIRGRETNGVKKLSFLGRWHLYNGHDLKLSSTEAALQSVQAVRVLRAAGCRRIVLCNAVGALTDRLKVRTPVLVADHIKGFPDSPILPGNHVNPRGAYSKKFRELCQKFDPALEEGILLMIRGRELVGTDAERKKYAADGADMAGMSVINEVIAASEEGFDEIGAISVITDDCAEGAVPSSILENAVATAPHLGQILSYVSARWS